MAFINEATPTIANITSVTVLAANPSRKFLLIQNNSAANIFVSLEGNVLTGIVPTATNIGFVIAPTGNYSHEYGTDSCPQGPVTIYQSSGGSINTVYVGEG